ncbi:MAG: acyl-CoA dehydrogenase family protein [Fodinibius sp.]|nr:acyl-CoA dehydrogenase family protein [Fodinibius sp.]
MSSNSFNIDDPFQFESELNEDDRMIMETARDYAQSQLEPRALKGNQEEYFDKDIATEMGDLGCWARICLLNMAVLMPVRPPMDLLPERSNAWIRATAPSCRYSRRW